MSARSGGRSLKSLMDLSGRVALVTGGAGHIGRAVSEALGELGAAVAVADLAGHAERGAEELRGHARDVLACPIDLESLDQVTALPGLVVERLGRLDVLVHCAALVGTSDLEGWSVPFAQQSGAETWSRALDVNLRSAFVLAQAAAPALGTSGHGSIVHLLSIYGLAGPDWRLYEGTTLGNPAAYAASKGGLLQLTRWLATTLAPAVRVNAISPGGVYRDTGEPFLSRYCSRTPLGRMATEEDLKGAVAYLASDLSAYVTGHNLIVDGGWTTW